jgi:molybdopterin converting factor small subunit
MKKVVFQNENQRTRIKIKVLYFAQISEILDGKHYEEIKVPNKTSVQDLLSIISSRNHTKGNFLWHNASITINCKIVDTNSILSDGDEVALLPPVTGG